MEGNDHQRCHSQLTVDLAPQNKVGKERYDGFVSRPKLRFTYRIDTSSTSCNNIKIVIILAVDPAKNETHNP